MPFDFLSATQWRDLLAVSRGEVRETAAGRVGGNLHTLRSLKRQFLVNPPTASNHCWTLSAEGRQALRLRGLPVETSRDQEATS